MKLKELLEILEEYNPEAEVGVLVHNRIEKFTLSYGSSEGCTIENAENVSFYVDRLCRNERETHKTVVTNLGLVKTNMCDGAQKITNTIANTNLLKLRQRLVVTILDLVESILCQLPREIVGVIVRTNLSKRDDKLVRANFNLARTIFCRGN